MTLLDWDKDVETMTDTRIDACFKALAELELWPAFKREFGWTGYATLMHTLLAEQNKRKRKSEELIDARFKRVRSTEETR